MSASKIIIAILVVLAILWLFAKTFKFVIWLAAVLLVGYAIYWFLSSVFKK